MPFAGAVAACSILLVLLLRAPFAEGQSSEATSKNFIMLEQVLSENGCGAFAGLVAATPAAGEAFRAQIADDDGLTIFCPDDEAVAAFGPGRFRNLSADGQTALLLYHGVAMLYSKEFGMLFERELRTLANGPGDYDIHIFDDKVIASSSSNEAFVTKRVVDDDRLFVYLVDSVLVPGERTSIWTWELVVFCIFIGLVTLVVALVPVVRLLGRSCQACAAAHASAARVTPHE